MLCEKFYYFRSSVTLKSTRTTTWESVVCLQTCGASAVNSFLVLVFLLFRERAVHSFHLADRCSSFSLGFGVKLIIKEDLIHRVGLEGAGLCWRLGSAVEVS